MEWNEMVVNDNVGYQDVTGGQIEVRSFLMRCCARSQVNTNMLGDVHDHEVIITVLISQINRMGYVLIND